MRTDLLPLCDQPYRAMEAALAPYGTEYSIESFRCSNKFYHRCFGEHIGYSTPNGGASPTLTPDQPVRDRHGRPMSIISIDRQHDHLTYASADPDCPERVLRT